jgi:hypothetical protein
MNFRNLMGVISLNEIMFSQEHNTGSIVTRLVNLH